MGGKSSQSTQQVTIPPDVLARYNSVNAQAQTAAAQPFQQYSTDPNAFVAPLTGTQQAGIANTNTYAGTAQPYYAAATQQLTGAQNAAVPYYAQATQNLGQGQDVGSALAGLSMQSLYGAQGAAAAPQQQAQQAYQQALSSAQPLNAAAIQQYYGGLAAAQPLQQAAAGNVANAQDIASMLSGQALGTIGGAGRQAQGIQQGALGGLGAAYGQAQPYNQAAAQYTAAGAQAVNPTQLGADQINQYMSPYLQTVLQGTAGIQNQLNQQAMAGQLGNAINQGAFGGDRAGLAAANLAQQQQLANAQTFSNILNQGYGQALSTAQGQQQLGLGAAQANRAAQQQAAQQYAALGQQQYGQGTGTAQAQANLANQMFGQGATQAQQQAAIAQQLFGVGTGTAQQQAALAQQLYGQAQGAGQNLAALGQQQYGQNLGYGQAQAAIGQQQYAQGANTAQQLAALGQQQFGQGATAAQQAAALGSGVYGMGASTAQQLANLGTAAQGAGLQGAQAQLAAGQTAQQTQQAGLSALYNQFLQQQSYPFQVAQFLANIAEGTGALSGSTTTTNQAMGGFSDARLKENIRKVGKTFDGQNIYSYNFKGSPKTEIGLMAQEVEHKHPEAMGLAGGYRTVRYDKATDEAAKRGHFAHGGTASAGGGVMPYHAGEGFYDGGFVGFDPGLMQQIMQSYQQMYAPMAGQHGGLGAAGYVPAASGSVGQLQTAGALPAMQDPVAHMNEMGKLGGNALEMAKKYGPGIKKGMSSLLGSAGLGGKSNQSAGASGDIISGYDPLSDVWGGTPDYIDEGAGMKRGGLAGARHGYALDGAVENDDEDKKKHEEDGATGLAPPPASNIETPKVGGGMQASAASNPVPQEMSIPEVGNKSSLAVAGPLPSQGKGGGGGGGIPSIANGLGGLADLVGGSMGDFLGGASDIAGAAEDILPFFLKRGGAVKYASGGKADDDFASGLNPLGRYHSLEEMLLGDDEPSGSAEVVGDDEPTPENLKFAKIAAAARAAAAPSKPADGQTPFASSGLAGRGLDPEIVSFFKAKGAPEGLARAIAAGVHAESGSNPGAVNPNSGAMGLGQWLGDRQRRLLQQYGAKPSKADQLEYLWGELTGGDRGGKSVMSAKDEPSALNAYITHFMRPKAGAETEGDISRGMKAMGYAEGGLAGLGDTDSLENNLEALNKMVISTGAGDNFGADDAPETISNRKPGILDAITHGGFVQGLGQGKAESWIPLLTGLATWGTTPTRSALSGALAGLGAGAQAAQAQKQFGLEKEYLGTKQMSAQAQKYQTLAARQSAAYQKLIGMRALGIDPSNASYQQVLGEYNNINAAMAPFEGGKAQPPIPGSTEFFKPIDFTNPNASLQTALGLSMAGVPGSNIPAQVGANALLPGTAPNAQGGISVVPGAPTAKATFEAAPQSATANVEKNRNISQQAINNYANFKREHGETVKTLLKMPIPDTLGATAPVWSKLAAALRGLAGTSDNTGPDGKPKVDPNQITGDQASVLNAAGKLLGVDLNAGDPSNAARLIVKQIGAKTHQMYTQYNGARTYEKKHTLPNGTVDYTRGNVNDYVTPQG